MIRTRFAPSPTGFLHIGSLRTALFSFLFARHNKGIFVLRIEDTDRERQVPGAVESIIKTLIDFNFSPDEGPGINDLKFGPYIQSERLELYKKYAQQLIERGGAYHCFCTPQRLEELKKTQVAQGMPPRYDGRCRNLSAEEVTQYLQQNLPHVTRHKMPQTGLTEYDDIVYGHLQFKNELLDDSILMKSDGFPVYNFANVVDDHLMEISHVIRGEEFISSTPKHVQLYRAFGWELPQFAHLPLILDAERKKLSKRFGDVSVEQYLQKGYLKPALTNFIALLGWNPKSTKEIFSLEELIEDFSLEKVNKSGAVFDIAKLDFINREWEKLLTLTPEQNPLFGRAKNYLTKLAKMEVSEEFLKKIWPQIIERTKGPSSLETDLAEFGFYFQPPKYKKDLLIWKKQTARATIEKLQLVGDYLKGVADEDFEKPRLEDKVKNFLRSREMSFGEVLWPLRVALSGQKFSPGPFEIMETFASAGKKDQIFERIDGAVKMLQE